MYHWSLLGLSKLLLINQASSPTLFAPIVRSICWLIVARKKLRLYIVISFDGLTGKKSRFFGLSRYTSCKKEHILVVTYAGAAVLFDLVFSPSFYF